MRTKKKIRFDNSIWSAWYAWHPIKMKWKGYTQWVWLERIERRMEGNWADWHWVYRNVSI